MQIEIGNMEITEFIWQIEDYHNFIHKTDPSRLHIYSKSFRPNLNLIQNESSSDNHQFFLELYHHEKQDVSLLAITLWNESLFECVDNLKILIQISILNKDGQLGFSKCMYASV